MDQHLDFEKKISEEATYIENHYEFSFDEAKDSLERGVKYFMDSGSMPEAAWEQTQELVATALEAAVLGAVQARIDRSACRSFSTCSSVWAALKLMRSLEVSSGTVGGLIPWTKTPWSRIF